jgi:hypothetical protein
MLEIYSIRRDWSRSTPAWYILYRTEPGMWENITIEAADEAAAAVRLKEVLNLTTMIVR